MIMLTLGRGGSTLLDRFAATLSYNNCLVAVMPLASHLGGQALEYEKDDTSHLVFAHRTLNEVAIDCNDSAMS